MSTGILTLLAILFHLLSNARCYVASQRCDLVFPYNSPYVTGYLEQKSAASGCVSNRTRPDGQEVHVISLANPARSSKANNVVLLKIQPWLNKGRYKTPLIFILNSNQSLRWKIDIQRISVIKKKHLIYTNEKSKVVFTKSSSKFRVVKQPLPSDKDQLIEWVQQEFQAVTSFSEFRNGNTINFHVRVDTSAPQVCRITENGQPSKAVATYSIHQPISGCLVTEDERHLEKSIHVIEVDRQALRQPGISTDIMLEIVPRDKRLVKRNILLVLKAPQSMKWKIRSRKVQDNIEIVTDRNVDLKEIKTTQVQIRSEDLSLSGVRLVEWVESHMGQVVSYTGVRTANRLVLALPYVEVSTKPVILPNIYHPDLVNGKSPFVNPSKTVAALQSKMVVDCRHRRMEATIERRLAMNLGISADSVSLQKKRCTARDNGTHIVVATELDECGTEIDFSSSNMINYTNTIIIHPTSWVDQREAGSGYNSDDVSGSGGRSEDTYMDDEDYYYHDIRIPIHCSYRQGRTQVTDRRPDTSEYHFTMYSTSDFRQPSRTVTDNTRIYLEATTSTDPRLRIIITSCWVLADDNRGLSSVAQIIKNKHMIIKNGCSLDPSVQWHNAASTNAILQQSQRFSFLFHADSLRPRYVHCSLTTCSKDGLYGYPQIEQCNDVKPCISIQDNVPSKRGQEMHEVVVGPIEVLRQENSNPVVQRPAESSSSSPGASLQAEEEGQSVVIEGLETATVVGIAFAAFIIGVLLTAALWFIHTHTGQVKRPFGAQGLADTSGQSTPNSSGPMAT